MTANIQRTYLGYMILAKPHQGPDGRFFAGFEIVRSSATDPRHAVSTYESHGSDAHTSATESEAVERAHSEARTWIEAKVSSAVFKDEESTSHDKLHIKKAEIRNVDRDGMYIANHQNVLVEDVYIDGAKHNGFVYDGNAPPRTQPFRFPADTDMRLLIELAQEIRRLESLHQDVPPTLLERSNLGQFLLSKGIDITALAANIATITTHPVVVEFFKRISS